MLFPSHFLKDGITPSNRIMSTEAYNYKILGIVAKIGSVPSIIGSFIILYRFYNSDASLKENLSHRIIFYMSLLDFVCSWNFFIGPWIFNDRILCTIQGFLTQMTVSAPLWNFAHTSNILLRVVVGLSAKNANRLEPLYHLIAWGIPFIGGILGVVRNNFIPVGGWCWFKASDLDLRFGTFYAWVFFCVVYNVVVAITVLMFIKKKQNDCGFKLSKRTLKSAKNQLLYVSALCVSFGPSSITRIVQSITGKEVFWLQVIQALTLPLQGFLNCIIYLKIHHVVLKNPLSGISSYGSATTKSYQTLSNNEPDSKDEQI